MKRGEIMKKALSLVFSVIAIVIALVVIITLIRVLIGKIPPPSVSYTNETAISILLGVAGILFLVLAGIFFLFDYL